MRNKFIISISVLALLISNTSYAKTQVKQKAKSHNSQYKAKTKKVVKSQNPKVPAIGSNGQNTEIASAQSAPIPSPDSVVTEPVAIEKRKVPPPPANLMSGKNSKLTKRETAAMAIATNYSNNKVMPTKGAEGVVVFPFGETMPSIVCAPLIVCDITLQPGEIINDINVGDAVRWKLSPATSGSGMNVTTHVIVKPTDAALQTNTIITTNRRTYVLKLVSRRTDYMARISFTYAEDMSDKWRDYKIRMGSQDNPQTEQGNLNFNYNISGAKPRWKPIRVYNDTSKTYIEFPDAIKTTEAPALLVLGDNQEQLVNYRVIGTKYIVDKIFDKAELISGTGKKQTKVTISRKD